MISLVLFSILLFAVGSVTAVICTAGVIQFVEIMSKNDFGEAVDGFIYEFPIFFIGWGMLIGLLYLWGF